MAENNNIEVGGRLHSIATGNVLTGSNEIFDDDKNKKQSEINTETYNLVNEVNAKLDTLNPEQQSALAVAAKANKNEANLGYYICETEANVAAKVIANATGYILSAGGSIKIKMNNVNTAYNPTLNINSTGANPLYYDGERASTTNTWEAGEIVEVYYDGTNFYANNVAVGGKFASGEKVKNVGIDSEPTAGSDNLVKSSGVQNELALGAVYDVSAKNPTAGTNNDGKWESLSVLLSDVNLNTLIPTAVRKGGMSIKFVYSSDNKYVQYRLMADSWSRNTEDWAIADESVYVENSEFVYVKTDAEGRILWAIKADGSIYFGAGVPTQVKDYIQSKISELPLDNYENIVTFLGNLIEGDALAILLDDKVNVEEGKGLSTNDYTNKEKELVNAHKYVYEPKYSNVETDINDTILGGRKSDGTKFEYMPIETPSVSILHQEDNEYINVSLDHDGHIIEGVEVSGKKHLVLPTNQDDILNESIKALQKNGGFIDIRSDNFDYYRECIFHDNFRRDTPDPEKPWLIGNNTGERNYNYYDYTSLYADTIDDGFRLDETNGKYTLINVSSNVVGFRIIKNLKYKSNIVVEFAMSDTLNEYQSLALNVIDANNYELLRFYNYKQGHTIIEHINVSGGVEYANIIPLSSVHTSNSVRFYFIGNRFLVYLDDDMVGSGELTNNVKNIGIQVDSTRNYKYKFFNVFMVKRTVQVRDTKPVVNRNIIDNDVYYVFGQNENVDPNNEYAYKLVNDVVEYGYCERFELRYYENMDSRSDRIECAFKERYMPLMGKWHFSFNFMLPSDYVLDELEENVFQIHESVYAVNSPCISLNVKPYSKDNTKPVLFTRIRADGRPSGSSGYVGLDYLCTQELCVLVPGKWYHIDVFVNQGYMPEHNPLTIVKVDGAELFKSHMPNSYNVCRRDYPIWGIYKASWMRVTSNTTKRIAYYANVKFIN